MVLAVLLGCLLLGLYFFYLRGDSRYFQLPSPGCPLPLLGHFHLLLARGGSQDPVGRLWQLYKQHSKAGLLWVRALNLELVFIGDFRTVKNVFNHPDVQGRTVPQITQLLKELRGVPSDLDLAGVILSTGDTWTEQRRFTLRALRDFGFGKAGMEEVIMEELSQFTKLLKTFAGQPVDIRSKFNLPLINILWRVASSEQFEYDDPKLINLLEKVTLLFQMANSPEDRIMMAHPWMNRLPLLRKLLKRDKVVEGFRSVLDLMRDSIEEHEQSMDVNMPRDFIDMVLTEIRETSDKTSSFYGETGKINLANTLIDLFLAGGETSSTTLSWAVVYMVRHPKVQEKVQEELARVVGEARRPGMMDRPLLPYTEATLMEVQRVANIGPNGLFHATTRDVTVNGFTIPANTFVFGLYSEILKGSHWGDGTVFRPERFLGADGRVVRDEQLMPFSIGKRQCLGESLARAELFLFFSGLLQQFSFTVQEGDPVPSEEYCPGLTILPKPFKVVITSRE